MDATRTFARRRQVRRSAAAVALTATALVVAVPPTPVSATQTITFAGAGVGAIPDGPGGRFCPAGEPLVVTFDVSGVTGTLTDVTLTITMRHPFVGDLDITLQSPDEAVISVFGGRCGTNLMTDFDGTYTITDRAQTTLVAAAVQQNGGVVPSGSYLPVSGGITAAFAGTALNGTWRLQVLDVGSFSVGAVSAASLSLSTLTVPVLSGSTWPELEVGQWATATATLTGDDPTGTVTFELFGPSDTECANPLHTETITITPDHGGFFTTAAESYQVSEIGDYRWKVSYSGDANNEAAETACGDETLTTQVVVVPVATMELVKTAELVDVDGNGMSPGDEVRYRFTVTNTGTVDVFSLAIEDPMLGVPIDCGPADDLGTNLPGVVVPAGQSLTCGPVSHVLAEAQLGTALNNTATASVLALVSDGTDSLEATASVAIDIPPPCAATITESPTSEPPSSEPPASEPPGTEPPGTEPPGTEPPASEPPNSEPAATEPPTTEPSTTEPPATDPTTSTTSTDPTTPSTGTVFGFARAAPTQVDPCGPPPPPVTSPPGTSRSATQPPSPPAPPPPDPPATTQPPPPQGPAGGGPSTSGSGGQGPAPTGQLPATR
jgi:hypothetical protein